MTRELIEGETRPGVTGRFFVELLESEDSDIYDVYKETILMGLEEGTKDITTLIDDNKPQVVKGFLVPDDSTLVNYTPIGRISIAGGTHFNRVARYKDVFQNKNYKLLQNSKVDFDPSNKVDMNVLFMKYDFLLKFPPELVAKLVNYIVDSLGESVSELIDRGDISKENFSQWIAKIDEQQEEIEETESTKRFFNSLDTVVQNKIVELVSLSTGLSAEEIKNEIGYSITMEDIHNAMSKFRF